MNYLKLKTTQTNYVNTVPNDTNYFNNDDTTTESASPNQNLYQGTDDQIATL
jgi:hypothetical protein